MYILYISLFKNYCVPFKLNKKALHKVPKLIRQFYFFKGPAEKKSTDRVQIKHFERHFLSSIPHTALNSMI